MPTRCFEFRKRQKKTMTRMKQYQEFKKQLGQSQNGQYETSLLWKTNSDELPTNKAGSLSQLRLLLKKLKVKPNAI